MAHEGRRPHLLVISCGGTISSTAAAGALGASPTLAAATLVAQLPQLAELAEVEAETFSTIPSAHMTLDDLLRLSRRLQEWVDGLGDHRGAIVVTHGTDTLEEAAFALDLMWANAVPVVLTGAMRNPSLPGTDGPANLLAAAVTAVTPDARGLGVLVVFNDEIHLARIVRKMHTSNVATFASPTVGPIGYLAEGRHARIVLHPVNRPHRALARPANLNVPVALLTVGIGEDDRLLEAVLRSGFAGVVIEGVGGGHLPPALAESAALARLVAEAPVVLASRTGAGKVRLP